jgi:hypothetical protein
LDIVSHLELIFPILRHIALGVRQIHQYVLLLILLVVLVLQWAVEISHQKLFLFDLLTILSLPLVFDLYFYKAGGNRTLPTLPGPFKLASPVPHFRVLYPFLIRLASGGIGRAEARLAGRFEPCGFRRASNKAMDALLRTL